MYKKNFLIILLIFMLCLIVGCNDQVEDVSYTIQFDSNCEQVFDNVVIKGKSTIELPTPTKHGYIFKGWYPSEDYMLGTEVTANSLIGKNITLYAKWDPIEIKITLDALSGHFADGTSRKEIKTYYNSGLELERVYLDNNLFMGWIYNNQVVTEDTIFTESTTITASYLSMDGLQKEYSVTLEFDEGSYYNFNYHGFWNKLGNIFKDTDNKEENSDEYDYSYKMIVCDFIRDYLAFRNVQEASQAKYSRYKISSLFKNTLIGKGGFFDNPTYHDKWLWLFEFIYTLASEENKPYFEALLNKEYTKDAATYDKEYQAISQELIKFLTLNAEESARLNYYDFIYISSYTIGEETILLSPHKEGFEFLGWYDNPDFTGEKITKINYNEYGDKIYYANWTKRG